MLHRVIFKLIALLLDKLFGKLKGVSWYIIRNCIFTCSCCIDCTGTISQLSPFKSQPWVSSVSLDGYLRIHDLNSKKQLFRFYLTQHLRCLYIHDDPARGHTGGENGGNGLDASSSSDNEDMDALWEKMSKTEPKKCKN
jgi:hypothetical protein